MGSGGNSASSRFNWCKVWTGVKCHFSSAHHHNQYVVGKLSISWVRIWNFTRIGRKTKKLWLSINPARRQWPGTTHKKVWTTTFLRQNLTSGTSLESSRSRKLKYAVSAGLAKRRKNYSSFKFLPKNLEKFRLTELYDAPLEGSTIFLYRSSLDSTSMESCRLAELKYAIFSGTGRKTKKLWCSKLFLSTVSKHRLLEISTFLFQYSSITRTPLESSRLGELKYANSAG